MAGLHFGFSLPGLGQLKNMLDDGVTQVAQGQGWGSGLVLGTT